MLSEYERDLCRRALDLLNCVNMESCAENICDIDSVIDDLNSLLNQEEEEEEENS